MLVFPICGKRPPLRETVTFPGVTAWVVPGSEAVKRQAEREGLDRIFRDAGFEWRSGAVCVAANGEQVPPGARAVSTSNRNFVGRQRVLARISQVPPWRSLRR